MRRPKLRDDPVFYRLRYSLIAQMLHARSPVERGLEPAHERDADPVGEVAQAIKAARRSVATRPGRTDAEPRPSQQALQLIELAAAELRRMGWRWIGNPPRWYARVLRHRNSPEDPPLGQFLDQLLEPAAVVLYWSCVVEEGEWERLSFLYETARPERRPRRLRRLALPRPTARRGRWLNRHRFARGWNLDREAWLRAYLLLLRDPTPGLKRDDRPVFARFGFARLRPMPAPNYRVRYNLACLFCRLANRTYLDGGGFHDAIFEEATMHLSRCLAGARGKQREAILDWARRDPSLAPLRNAWSEGFEEVVSPYLP